MTRGTDLADRRVLAVFVATIGLGGSNAVAIRVGLEELPPIWSAVLRFGLATLIFVVMAAIVRPPMPRGRTLAGAVVYGLVGFAASYTFAYLGLVNGGAGTAQVVIASAPLLTLLLAVGLGLERFHWQGLAGSLLAAAGIVVVFGDQIAGRVPLVSLVFFAAGAFCIAGTAVLVKRLPPGHPIPANAVGMAVGTLALAALSLVLGERWSVPSMDRSWLSVLYLASVGSVGLFLAYLYVLARWPASASSYAMLLMPLWTVAVASVVLGETARPLFLVGGALVLAGTYVAVFRAPRPQPQADCQPPEAAPIAAGAPAEGPAG
jgi:drug/metabolite transporter (DMT)-like permease